MSLLLTMYEFEDSQYVISGLLHSMFCIAFLDRKKVISWEICPESIKIASFIRKYV